MIMIMILDIVVMTNRKRKGERIQLHLVKQHSLCPGTFSVCVTGMLAYCHTLSAERNLPLHTIFIETVFAPFHTLSRPISNTR
jgi:hypothetical protein